MRIIKSKVNTAPSVLSWLHYYIFSSGNIFLYIRKIIGKDFPRYKSSSFPSSPGCAPGLEECWWWQMLGSFCIVGILILSVKDISSTWLSFDCELKVLFLVSSLSSFSLKFRCVQWCSSISVNIPQLSKYSTVSTLHCFLHSYTHTDTLLLITT